MDLQRWEIPVVLTRGGGVRFNSEMSGKVTGRKTCEGLCLQAVFVTLTLLLGISYVYWECEFINIGALTISVKSSLGKAQLCILFNAKHVVSSSITKPRLYFPSLFHFSQWSDVRNTQTVMLKWFALFYNWRASEEHYNEKQSDTE